MTFLRRNDGDWTGSPLHTSFPIPDIKPTGDDNTGTGDGPEAWDIGLWPGFDLPSRMGKGLIESHFLIIG